MAKDKKSLKAKNNTQTKEEVIREAELAAKDEKNEYVIRNEKDNTAISVIAYYDFMTKKTYKISGKGLELYAVYQARMPIALILVFVLWGVLGIKPWISCAISLVALIVSAVLYRVMFLYKQTIIETDPSKKKSLKEHLTDIAMKQDTPRMIRLIAFGILLISILYFNIEQRGYQPGDVMYIAHMVIVYFALAVIGLQAIFLGIKLMDKLQSERGGRSKR